MMIWKKTVSNLSFIKHILICCLCIILYCLLSADKTNTFFLNPQDSKNYIKDKEFEILRVIRNSVKGMTLKEQGKPGLKEKKTCSYIVGFFLNSM
jgi:hypothetical protein